MHKPQPTQGMGLSRHKPSTQFSSKTEMRGARSPGPHPEKLLRIWSVSSICLSKTKFCPSSSWNTQGISGQLLPARCQGGDAVGRPRSGTSCAPLYRMVSDIPGLHPLEANSTLSSSCDQTVTACLVTDPTINNAPILGHWLCYCIRAAC